MFTKLEFSYDPSISIARDRNVHYPVVITCGSEEFRFETAYAHREAVTKASEGSKTVNKTIEWSPQKTALIVVDMWDDHWCEGRPKRVEEMAGPMNKLIAEARNRGVLIIHCPSTCVDFYKDSAARRRASDAPFAKTRIKLADDRALGHGLVLARQGPRARVADRRFRHGLRLREAVRDRSPGSGRSQRSRSTIAATRSPTTAKSFEPVCPARHRKRDHLRRAPEHVRPRPAVRYSPNGEAGQERRPDARHDRHDVQPPHAAHSVDHFTGTDLVVEHVERYWCPTIESTDLIGEKPFRFAEDTMASVAAQR